MEKSKSENNEEKTTKKTTKVNSEEKTSAKKTVTKPTSKKVTASKKTTAKTATVKSEDAKTDAKNSADKKSESTKVEAKKVDTKKVEAKETKNKKAEAKKTENKKSEPEKIAGEVTIEIDDKPKKKRGSVVLGIIGGILGGFIATIPWILMYVYGNMILSALSIFIAAGVYYGYKLFNGKINKALPAIIIVLSLLIVAITTLGIIPGILLAQDGIAINMDTVKNLYSNKEFLEALSKDAVISILFTVIGASAMASTIKRKMKSEEEAANLNDSSETEENIKAKKKGQKTEKIATVVIGLILIIAMVATVYIEKTGILKSVDVADGEISFTIKGDWEEYTSYYNEGYTYTRYINSREATEEELEQEEIDYSLYPAFFSVSHFQIDTEQIKSIDDIKTSLDEYFESLEEKPEDYEGNVIKTKNGYDAYYVKMKDTSSVDRVEYICYILNSDEMATINAYSFTLEDDKELEKTIKQTIDSFRWE